MKTAWLYAGQGSQKPGMGRDFYDTFPETREIFESPAAGLDLRALCFEADAGTLARTRHTQPCMAAFAAAVTLLLKNAGQRPDFAAGLSLGEYSALHASGVFGYETLLGLLAFRGLAMERSAMGIPSRMTAVLGLGDTDISRAVEDASPLGVVAVTNRNCPGQTVIGGEERAVLAAEQICLSLGAKRCLPLDTSGPFHTPLMESASVQLREKLGETELSPQGVPVVFNATGELAPDSEARELLCLGVRSPVLFEKTIGTLGALGAEAVIEIGPGRALSGFVRRSAPDMRVISIESAEDFKKAADSGFAPQARPS
ncbi:MAG: ACP S-malonyltransferase [Oscillospiraceae bacterium]|jgi:[acyl-carrier-protein] S-malonyltransferase|nr:ACP S-malonyltransferase [Oscillospiraceae bacterium]